ncbi:MAG TPA: hypothetical protein VEF53_18945 [Patescibacteria group bacterium]|nr:hypothetical protein [Patescibacteria group bacterium]
MFISTKTVQDFIADLDAMKPNKYSPAIKVGWINEIEQSLYTKIIDEYKKDSTTYATANLAAFPLAIGTAPSIQFEDIRKVYVGGVEYSKTTLAYDTTAGVYFKNTDKLDINPRPVAPATVAVTIVYRERPVIKTVPLVASQYISLPDAFIKIVTYYCFQQIHLLQKEYAEAQNWMAMYNDAVADFVDWYGERKAQFGN